MAHRARDWFKQAEADLRLARFATEAGSNEWSCFAAQQAAEKAIKAALLENGTEGWGHTLTVLVRRLAEIVDVPELLIDRCRVLDKHYIPSMVPSMFDSGAPTDFYVRAEALQAIEHADTLMGFCRSLTEQSQSIPRGA